MQEPVLHQPVAMTYIASDLSYDETLSDFRMRAGTSRRRWWRVGQR